MKQQNIRNTSPPMFIVAVMIAIFLMTTGLSGAKMMFEGTGGPSVIKADVSTIASTMTDAIRSNVSANLKQAITIVKANVNIDRYAGKASVSLNNNPTAQKEKGQQAVANNDENTNQYTVQAEVVIKAPIKTNSELLSSENLNGENYTVIKASTNSFEDENENVKVDLQYRFALLH